MKKLLLLLLLVGCGKAIEPGAYTAAYSPSGGTCTSCTAFSDIWLLEQQSGGSYSLAGLNGSVALIVGSDSTASFAESGSQVDSASGCTITVQGSTSFHTDQTPMAGTTHAIYTKCNQTCTCDFSLTITKQ